MARLLQDPRVRATINGQDNRGQTALHRTCGGSIATARRIHMLPQAGAGLTIRDYGGLAPLNRVRLHHPDRQAIITLFEQDPDASLLVKARRFAVTTISSTVTPSYLHDRLVRRQPLPRVALAPVTDEQADEEGKESRKLRTTLAFMCGFGREAMPRDIFLVVMDLLMPSWNPLRRKNVDTGQPLRQG